MSHSVGRHRAPERYNPLAEIGTVISQTGTPLAKGSAVLAASGGLVAAIAIPAQAAPAVEQADATPAAAAAPAAPAAAAVTAPSATATAKATSADFGQIEVEPVAKPTGPTPYPLRMRAEREQARQEAAAERQREQEQAAEARRAEQAREAQEEQRSEEAAASRSQERQATTTTTTTTTTSATTPAPASTPEPTQAPSAPAPASGGVIAIAKQYIGVPYVYGGSTPSGFDCSGFTQYVFAKAGKSLPRVTTAQQAAATPVSDPQPGDIVFFGNPAYHNGIYAGDGKIIDAGNSSTGVTERDIWTDDVSYGRF